MQDVGVTLIIVAAGEALLSIACIYRFGREVRRPRVAGGRSSPSA